jgi:hypothetical protein
MKPRYNLRIQPAKPLLSTKNKKVPTISSCRVFVINIFFVSDKRNLSLHSRTKKPKSRHSNPLINQQNRRHSLRLTPTITETKSRTTIHETSNRKTYDIFNQIIIFFSTKLA